ncbi:phosphatase PAP2 family protein [Halobacteria archaeon AArc-dxtr1]|nr:phosphatase PAP2 family protein [Halobacteria archaeon AArc-dxtr1]
MLFDPATVEAVRDLSPVWLVLLLTVLSFLGSTFYQVPMLIVCYVIEARERTATWLAIVAGGYSFRSLLKHLNDVSRPPVDSPMDPASFPALVRPIYEHPAEISTTSFPSGHVIAATVLWGLLVVDTDVGTRRQRLSLAGTVVFIVAASRVVLGAHYIEDVVAGLVFGLVFLGVALSVRDRSARPVAATAGLAAAVSLTVVSFTASTTASTVLGASVGMLAAVFAPDVAHRLRRLPRRIAAAWLLAGTAVAAAVIVLSSVLVHLLAIGFVAGATVYWLPRQQPIRSLMPTVTRRVRAASKR